MTNFSGGFLYGKKGKTVCADFEENSVWVDRETGVNYLWHSTGHAGGMTPLLDREGKPIITTLLEEKE